MIADTRIEQNVFDRTRNALGALYIALKEDPWQAILASLPLIFCVPWNPAYSSRNYEYQLHLAYVTGLQYGKDILATYGPLGFLTIPFFHPRTFPILILFNVLVYIFLIVRLIVVSRRLGEARYGARVAIVCLPTAVISVPEWAPILFVPYLLVLVYVLDLSLNGWKLKWRPAAVYGIVFAAFTLAKMTFAPLIVPIVTVAGIAQIHHRSLPRTILVYFPALILLWTVFGQSIGNIPAFLASSSEIVAGYKHEMEYWELAALYSMMFLVIAYVMIWSASTIAIWRRLGAWAGAVTSVALSLVFYAALMNGFVRGDSYHVLPCILTTFGLWGLVELVIGAACRNRRSRLVAASWLAFGAILFALSYEWRMLDSMAHANFAQIADRPLGLARLTLKGDRHLKAMTREADDRLRPRAIPGLKGRTVDVPNGDPGIALVSGGRLRLRPTITAYSGYTPLLTGANAKYLEGKESPGAILLTHPLAIDGKFPTTEDPRTWLSLLTHYEYSTGSGDYDVLRRRSSPLQARLAPLLDRTIGFDDELDVDVLRESARATWAEIEINPTTAGRFVAMLFKPMPVYMISKLANGTKAIHRINVGMARTGFLLSPFLGDRGALRALFSDDQSGSRGEAVKSIRIDGKFRIDNANTNLRLDKFYDSAIKVRLFNLYLDRVVDCGNDSR